MTAVFYDSTSAPVYLSFSSGTVMPDASGSYFFRATPLTIGGTTGSVVIYASLFSGFPGNGGYPHCPEWQMAFTINSPIVPLKSASRSASLLSSDGTYSLQFRLLSTHGHY